MFKVEVNQTAFSILDEAAAAIGGWTASIKSVHLDSEGQDWEPWQAYEVGGTVDVSTFRIATDLDLGASVSRVEMDAEVVYPWPHRVAYIEITDAKARLRAEYDFLERLLPQLRKLLDRRRVELRERQENGEDFSYRTTQEQYFGKFFSQN